MRTLKTVVFTIGKAILLFVVVITILCGVTVFSTLHNTEEANAGMFVAPTEEVSYFKEARAVCERAVAQEWGRNTPSFYPMIEVCSKQINKYSQALGHWPSNASANFAPSSTWSEAWDVANKVSSKFVKGGYYSEESCVGNEFVVLLVNAILAK